MSEKKVSAENPVEYVVDGKKHFREMFERDHKVKLVDKRFVETAYPEFYKWIQNISWRNGKSIIYGINDQGTKEERLRVFLYTHCSRYNICIRKPNNDKGYIGCTVSNRMERPGETWKRGRDLPDGPFEQSTMLKIIYGIIAYELKSVPNYYLTTE